MSAERPSTQPGAGIAGAAMRSVGTHGPAASGIPEIFYRLARPARGRMPGAHRSSGGDGGFEFRSHAPLQDVPDARRLDLLASLRDPFGQWLVRRHSQPKAVPVVVVADLSASMAFKGQQARPAVLAALVESLAWSAWRQGDRFGFIGCAERIDPAWLLPATRQRQAGLQLAQALRGWQPGPGSRHAQALTQAAAWLGRERSLLFLVSDFHLPAAVLRATLASLAAHEVVPVLLSDPHEHALPQRSGLLRTLDPETGQRRLLWWRPALRERWAAAWAAQRAAVWQACADAGTRPLRLEGAFDADAFTRHFSA